MAYQSKRMAILAAWLARLQVITAAGGFETESGQHVWLGELPVLGPDDPDAAIAVLVGDDELRWQQANLLIEMPLQTIALAKADLDQPWFTVEQVLSDIKRAVEREDRTLGGLVKQQFMRGQTQTLEREAGSTIVGAAITYTVPYVEGWGTP